MPRRNMVERLSLPSSNQARSANIQDSIPRIGYCPFSNSTTKPKYLTVANTLAYLVSWGMFYKNYGLVMYGKLTDKIESLCIFRSQWKWLTIAKGASSLRQGMQVLWYRPASEWRWKSFITLTLDHRETFLQRRWRHWRCRRAGRAQSGQSGKPGNNNAPLDNSNGNII